MSNVTKKLQKVHMYHMSCLLTCMYILCNVISFNGIHLYVASFNDVCSSTFCTSTCTLYNAPSIVTTMHQHEQTIYLQLINKKNNNKNCLVVGLNL